MTMQTTGHNRFLDDAARALKPYGYEWALSWTGIAGPGSQIIVFAGPGDFYTACLTHDNQVVWVMTCGGQEVDANTDECNALNRAAREFYQPTSESNDDSSTLASQPRQSDGDGYRSNRPPSG